MAGIRSIHRGPTMKGYATRNSAPFRIDDTSSELKVNPTGSGTTEKTIPVVEGLTPVAVTAATVSLTAALHGGRAVYLNRAGGIAATLPAATGSGVSFLLFVGATFTAAASIAVANAQDYMVGLALFDKVGTVSGFATANTGTVATESDTCSMFTGASNTAGGIKGAMYEIVDIAANVWGIQARSEAGGTVVTPFSAAV